MRKILFILGILCQLSLLGQNNKIVYLNTGKMYVDKKANAKTTLLIDGSFKADNASLIEQNGYTILKGNFYNDVSSGNVFSLTGTGIFEFRGTKAQYIYGTADKEQNFVNFPELYIHNLTKVNNEAQDSAAVVIAPNVGISTQNISLFRGRLILDSKAIINGTTDTRTSEVAHLLVNGDVSYDMILGSYIPGFDNKEDRGIIQVKLAIGDHYKNGYLIGFTPPFKKIYNDYFFYNFISRPTNRGLFGDQGQLIINPKVGLESGKGYIVGFGIIPENDPYYQDNWSPEWSGTIMDDRMKDMMSFARNYAPYSLSNFVDNDLQIGDRYKGEVLNVSDVAVGLEEGWNYVGNPFTVPIDMSSFLEETSTSDQWGVSRGPLADAEVENKYYILTQGYGSHLPNLSPHSFRFDVTYLVAQKVGNTITLDGAPDAGQIAPMQLFVIKKNAPGKKNLIIPKMVRTHGKGKYLRNAKSESTFIDNELLIETKDLASGAYDRLCVVFREDAKMAGNDQYDASKIFNNSEGVNQIYTLTDKNEAMTTNVIPFSVQSLKMHLKPSFEEQNILLKAHRIASLSKEQKVILEDRKTGKFIDLLNNQEYRFSTSPSDQVNRFVLHFNNPSGIPDENNIQSDIRMNYSQGVINIYGLAGSDIGSNIQIIDIQGRIVFNSTVNNHPDYSVSCPLNSGIYILKITDRHKTPFLQKFIAK